MLLFIAAWLPNIQLLVMTEKYLQTMKDCMYVVSSGCVILGKWGVGLITMLAFC